jgi:general L-amino acid transport system permease protein
MSGAPTTIRVHEPTGLAARLRDPRVRGIVFQALTGLGFALLVWFIASNVIANLRDLGVNTGFDFLGQPSGFDISFSLIPFDPTDTHMRVFVVGMINTLFVAVLGIPAAMVLGLIMGVLRLSDNWLVTRLVGVYIEIVRNIPLLLQIFFWQAMLWTLPPVRNSISLGDAVFLNKRALYLPKPIFESGIGIVLFALVAGIVLALLIRTWRSRRRATTGQAGFAWAGPVALIGLPVLAVVATGVPWSFELPEAGRFNFSGGIQIPDTLVALWLGLVVYTGAFIAEIVRAGIQSVSKGQREAAQAVGLTQSQTMNLIILPQAVRVIIPPTTSQFLNLMKNSSLAVFIGYPDIVAVFAGTSLNQTGQAIEIIALSMLFYLVVSLSISLLMNWYNRTMALVER